MRKLILRLSTSIDGYIESSHEKLNFGKSRSPEGAAWLAQKLGSASAHLMGRKAFCEMAAVLPNASGPMAQAMNDIPKIVFSNTGFNPAQATQAKGWTEAQVLAGDLATEILNLKRQTGGDLIAHGGIAFAQNLVQTGLIDEFCIAVHPVAAGKGFGLFEKLGKPLYLKLIDSKIFSTGAMVQIYQPE